MYGSNAVVIKIPAGLFAEIGKLASNFMWKYRGPRIAKTILNNQVRKLILSDFNTYYKATLINSYNTGIQIDEWTKGRELRVKQ